MIKKTQSLNYKI